MTLVSFLSDKSVRSRYTDTAVPVYARTFTVTLILLYRYTPVPLLEGRTFRFGRFFEFLRDMPVPILGARVMPVPILGARVS